MKKMVIALLVVICILSMVISYKVYASSGEALLESDTAGKLINKLHSMHADGIIFQDMAILNMALNGKLPDIKLIASTQCDNRNLEKVKFFENTGVGRVILARELSLTQIKEICSKTSIEI